MLRSLLPQLFKATQGMITPSAIARCQHRILSTCSQKLQHPEKENHVRILDRFSTIDHLIIKKGDTLPFVHTLNNGTSLRIENVTNEFGEKAWSLLHSMIVSGEGYSESELEPLNAFLENSKSEGGNFQIVDVDKNVLVCVLAMRPTPLSRNERPVHYSAFMGMNPEYRGKGIAQEFLTKITLDLGRGVLGYRGVIVARAAISRGCHVMVHAGCHILGTIQNCSYLKGVGWVPDIIFSSIYKKEISKRLTKEMPQELPPLQIEDFISSDLQSHNPRITNFPKMGFQGAELKVELACPTDIWKVEEMMRKAAQTSAGFAVDEFNMKGHFNRKLFYDSNVIVVKVAGNTDNDIVAAAIFGCTKLSRAYNDTQAGGYIIVKEDHRNKGLGTCLLEYLLKLAPDAGYRTIVTDVFTSNGPGLRLLQKGHFTTTGSMPHCGYIKKDGFTDSLVHYLKI